MGYELMEIEMVFDDLSERIEKTKTSLSNEFKSMRAGRANPHILDKVLVPYYGVDTPINQMANITIPEARMLVINVWDQSAIKTVEKAIIAANLGIFPTNDGKVLRMVFPELTEERRRALCKDVRVSTENAKVAIRNIRRDANDAAKVMKKNSEITEDDLKEAEKRIQDLTDKIIKEVDAVIARKDKEIMEI